MFMHTSHTHTHARTHARTHAHNYCSIKSLCVIELGVSGYLGDAVLWFKGMYSRDWSKFKVPSAVAFEVQSVVGMPMASTAR